MTEQSYTFDVLVVGAGPAGISAAWAAREAGGDLCVGIVDDNPGPGGQIWRGGAREPSTSAAAQWFQAFASAKISFVSGATVFAHPASGLLFAETIDGVCELGYRKLILATGARERFLPFPGWTLPNVMGAGGLQAMVKSGLPIAGKRVVIAGTGPLLLAVAAFLKKRGAKVMLIAEQASRFRIARFAAGLFAHPGKIHQARQMRKDLSGVPYLFGCWPVAASGNGQLQRVTLQRSRKTWSVECDYLACGFHLVPNTELAELLGCELQDDSVAVNQWQQTSLPGVFCAGEPTGIGGLELALVEGQIAGYAATEREDGARRLFTERSKLRGFADLLERTFRLRDELKSLPLADTFVCRCEDVAFNRLRRYDSWRAAKLETRCGMGACQGRVCGAAAEFLFGWKVESVRPPIFPARVEVLSSAGHAQHANTSHD